MSTFLQIAQKVARESGTISTPPSTVVGNTGQLQNICNWVIDSWIRIQNQRGSWVWMRQPLPSTALTTINSAYYSAASWNITDLAAWLHEDHETTIYNNSTGVSDEGEIEYVEWSDFRRSYTRGVQTAARPRNFSIDPQGQIWFGPKPDAIYRANGEYRQTVQTLAADADIPNCPARFHDVIAWLALKTLAEFDEALADVVTRADQKYKEMLFDLERDQLPPVTIGQAGPIA